MRSAMLEAWALLALAAGLALGVNHVRGLPLRPGQSVVPSAATLNAREAKTLLDRGAVFLDARSQRDYDSGHIAGALLADVSRPEVRPWRSLPRATILVVYCHSAHCGDYTKVLQLLNADGYVRAMALQEGWLGWNAARLPIRSGPQP